MLKMLGKSGVLLLIILSVFFIANPSACSNLLAGRETNGPTKSQGQGQQAPLQEDQQSLSIEGEESAASPAQEQGIFDTNSMNAAPSQTFSQQDIDYAIASRYVELEREYAQTQPVGKDSSKEISFIVMDDFEMSPAEWESFLSRATETDLFNRVRKEMPFFPSSVPETVSVTQ